MNTKLLFSVIIPTCHRNDLLAKCLDCLAPGIQTLPATQYEVIVTDDGSVTTAEQMIYEKYTWVRWVAGPRKGPAANRNNGAKHARGEWLVFTDDDCLPERVWLTAFSAAIVSDALVYEGKTTCKAGIKSPLEHAPINLTGGYLWSCNVMVKSSLFADLKGFDENFPYPQMEDVDFKDRILGQNFLIKFVEDAVIDHPPKKVPFGWEIGKLHESHIYYWHRKKGKKITLRQLIYNILKFRLASIKHCTISRDSAVALASIVFEILFVVRNISHWYKLYPLAEK